MGKKKNYGLSKLQIEIANIESIREPLRIGGSLLSRPVALVYLKDSCYNRPIHVMSISWLKHNIDKHPEIFADCVTEIRVIF